MESFAVFLLGGGVRMVEALAFSTPYLLVGVFVAALFRRVLEPEQIVALFGGRSWRNLPQSWLLGMLLPVCSLGVLPIIRELRRAGVPGGAIVAFALTAPLFNPLSVLYGLTLSHPGVILCFTFCSLLLVSLVGILWGPFFDKTTDTSDRMTTTAQVPYGWRRMVLLVSDILKELTSPTLLYIVLALLGVAALAWSVPYASLQTTMAHDDPRSPLMMAAVAAPLYTTPTYVMAQLGSMFDHGNSIGAALVLLTLGAGVNLGLVVWIFLTFGWRAGCCWLVLFFGVVLTVAYLLEKPLYDCGDPANHTHAFDMYAFPFYTTHDWEMALSEAQHEFHFKVASYEWQGLKFLGVLIGLGLILRLAEQRFPLEAWLTPPAAPIPTETPAPAASEQAPAQLVVDQPKTTFQNPSWDLVVPPRVLGAIALIGLIFVSILGCYVFYPPVETALAEMSQFKTNALYNAKFMREEEAEKNILFWDELTRRLEVSAMIRGITVTAEMKQSTEILRKKLDELRHALEDKEEERVRQLMSEITQSYNQVRQVYLKAVDADSSLPAS